MCTASNRIALSRAAAADRARRKAQRLRHVTDLSVYLYRRINTVHMCVYIFNVFKYERLKAPPKIIIVSEVCVSRGRD